MLIPALLGPVDTRSFRSIVPPALSFSPDRLTAAEAQAASGLAAELLSQREAVALGQQVASETVSEAAAPGAIPRPNLRPSTLPLGRSWMTGGQAPKIGERH